MRMQVLFVFAVFAAHNFGVAHANPDGAPWGAADPNAAQNCASCHYDNEAVMDSPLIVLAGDFPGRIEPDQEYEIMLLFGKIENKANIGFMASSKSGETVIGEFVSIFDAIEIRGGEVRSNVPERNTQNAIWPLKWRAPNEPIKDVTFFFAVNAGNDDQSPLGDQVHFKTVTFQAE